MSRAASLAGREGAGPADRESRRQVAGFRPQCGRCEPDGPEIWKIALPSALPDIFAGLRLALTVSLILAVVAEMLAGTIGLGQNITLAARSFRSADLYAGIVVLGAVGYATNILLARIERHLLRWRAP